MKRLIAAGFAVSVACAELPSSLVEISRPDAASAAQAQTLTFKLITPIQFSAWTCTEFVTLQGELVMLQHLSSNDQGSHAKVLFLQRLTGFGQTTGRRYIGIGNSNAVGNTALNGAVIYNEVFSFRLVSNGALLRVSTRIHATLNANGDVTAQILDTAVDCNVQ